MSVLELQPADFDTQRFCPFHGDFVRLADCPIVATSSQVVAAASSAALGPSSQLTLTSEFDKLPRVLLSQPPERPEVVRRRFGRPPTHRLPLPAELAGGTGAARARPARACPECRHPLPAGIDVRDPISISLVGHTAASKTTTLVALTELVRESGPSLIDLDEFMPTETTAEAFRTKLIGHYRQAGRVGQTSGRDLHAPLEFFAGPGRFNRPINLLFHDVAGEQLMSQDQRLTSAPAVLWSDLVIFFYNPEESPRLNLISTGIDQAKLLNGVYADIIDYTSRRDPRDGTPVVPPLIMLLCKSDLLPGRRSGELLRDKAVQAAITNLGDGDVVAAGKRWPEVYWQSISAQPVDGDQPRGVVEAFQLAAKLISERA